MASPIIAIVGNVKADGAPAVAESLGRELGKAGFRVLVYSSGVDFLEGRIVRGLVAIGHGIAILALATFDGTAAKVWDALRPGRDLPSADEVSLMARPGWSDDRAADCAGTLKTQIARKVEQERQRRVEERRRRDHPIGVWPSSRLYERRSGFRPPRTIHPWETYVPFDRVTNEPRIEQRQ